MSRFISMSRLRPVALSAMYLREAPQLVLLSIAIYVSATLPAGWFGRWPLVLISVLAFIRIVTPVYRWYSYRYEVSETHLTEVAGVLQRRTRSLAWSDVTAIEVHVPWSHRVPRLASVTVKTDGSADTTVRLDGVDQEDAEELRSRARGFGRIVGNECIAPRQLSTADGGQPLESIYRAGPADLLAASLFYGQFIVLACAFIGALTQFAELVQAGPVLEVVERHPIVSLVILAIFGSAVGCGLTVVKFHNFEVAHDPHSLVLQYGLLNTQERTVRRADAIGIRLRRNLVEMLFDRVRVSLITTDSSQQLGTNLVLPSLSRAQVTQVLSPVFPQYRGSLLLENSGRGRILVVGAVTAVPFGLGAGAFVAVRHFMDWSWYFELLPTAAMLLLALAAVRLATTRFNFSRVADGALLWRSLLAAQTEYVVQVDSIHAATTVGLGVGCREARRLFRLHFYAGLPKTLTALVPDDRGFHAAALAATRYAENIATARKRKKVTA